MCEEGSNRLRSPTKTRDTIQLITYTTLNEPEP